MMELRRFSYLEVVVGVDVDPDVNADDLVDPVDSLVAPDADAVLVASEKEAQGLG